MANEGVPDYSSDFSPENASDKDGDNSLPKRDHLLQWMELSVSEPEKRTGQGGVKMQDTYVVYLVESKVKDPDMPGYGNPPLSLWRRYSEFELLKNYLEITYPWVVVPVLPEKRTSILQTVSHAWQKLPTDRFDTDFIERRRVGLENFLLRVASHTVLSKDKVFHGFIKQDDGWKESVYATDFQNKADSWLRSISASYRLKKTDRRFEELKNYSNELQTNITNILRIRTKLADRMYGMHRLHANYGRVFKEWAGIEREMSDGLNNAGNFMEVYATSIEAILEDEEQFADQLKEYYAFGDSLKAVCKKQELLQLSLENAEDSLTYRENQRDALAAGKSGGFSLSGMKSKLFGGDTPEQREQKIKQLDEQIHESDREVDQATKDVDEFVEMSLKDIERFKRQKTKDMKDVFLNYSVMQIERCKKSAAMWQNAKESFGKM